MEFFPEDNCPVMGTLPNGDSRWFDSEKEYEDEFWDMVFEMSNGFELEMPEDFVA